MDGHSWDEFKDELIANYPEAAAAERGTPARIRQLCRGTEKVGLGNMPALYAFRRAFMAEAKKLQKPPDTMANRELVELFISCLSELLASALLQHLGNQYSNPSTVSNGKRKEGDNERLARRPEDQYDLEEVCKAALQVSENSQGMFSLIKRTEERGVFLLSQPVSETKALAEKLNDLEGKQALEKDHMVSMEKMLDSKMKVWRKC